MNLVSVPSLAAKGLNVSFEGQLCVICAGSEIAAVATKQWTLYVLDATNISGSHTASRVMTSKASVAIWHYRLGHTNIKNILTLDKKGMIVGVELLNGKEPNMAPCKACLEGKQHHELRCVWADGDCSTNRTLLLCHLY